MFNITQGKGFVITFANSWTISVQWGPGNYCDHYHAIRDIGMSFEDFFRLKGEEGSACAEIAVITPEGNFLPLDEFDSVRGYVMPDEVARITAIVATNPESLRAKLRASTGG